MPLNCSYSLRFKGIWFLSALKLVVCRWLLLVEIFSDILDLPVTRICNIRYSTTTLLSWKCHSFHRWSWMVHSEFSEICAVVPDHFIIPNEYSRIGMANMLIAFIIFAEFSVVFKTHENNIKFKNTSQWFCKKETRNVFFQIPKDCNYWQNP